MLKLGITKLINNFGQEVVSDWKLLALALKLLRKDERYKAFLEKEAVKCLENNIKGRAISKKILKLLKPHHFDEETSNKIEHFAEQLGNLAFKAKREIAQIIKDIRKLFKEKSSNKKNWTAKDIYGSFEILEKECIIYGKNLYNSLQLKSTIYTGIMKSYGQKVVVKEYKIEKTNKAAKNLAFKEAANAIFLSKKDEIFIEFNGIYVEFDPKDSEFTFGIVMEKCDMGLERAIINKWFNDDKQIENCIDALLKGFKLLHDYGIAHREIKPKNIFAKKTNKGLKLKIADYSISSLISKGIEILPEQDITDFGSQIAYYASEMYSKVGINYHHQPSRIIINKHKVDVFALGLVFLELYRQEIPFINYSEREEWMENVGLSYIRNDIKAIWVKNLLISMLTKIPNERKRFSELVKIRKNSISIL